METKIKVKQNEKLGLLPPEPEYLAEKFIVKVPVSDDHLKDPWQLRVYAERLLEKRLGDEVQMTGLKVKKPHLAARSAAKLRRREPYARLFVTIKF